MADMKAFGAGIVIVVIIFVALLVAFYLSPFSEVNITRCDSLKNIPNPAGAQMSPTCGYVIFSEVPFPFRLKSSEFIDFCRRNIKTVEDSCDSKIDTTILFFTTISYSEKSEYQCTYFMNNETKAITLTKHDASSQMNYGSNTIPYGNLVISIDGQGYYGNDSWFNYTSECKDLKARLR